MKTFIAIMALAVLTGLAAPVASAAEANFPGLEGIPEVVAEVDGTPISRLELMRELVGSSGTKALERLVHRILVEQAAAERHVVVTDQDIELQYKADKQDLGADLIHIERNPKAPVPMEEMIRSRYGMDAAEYKNTIVRQRLLARRCLGTDINPTDDELRKFFETYPDLFQEQVKYRAAHILISPLDPRDINGLNGRAKTPFGQMLAFQNMQEVRANRYRDENVEFKDTPKEEIDDGWRVAKIQAEQLTQELQAYPQRWNDYVKKYSRDPMDHAPLQRANSNNRNPAKSAREQAGLLPGEVGWFNKYGPMVRDFYNGAKAIRAGQIGGPVQTKFGWHIVKMMDVSFPQVVTFAQVKEKVRRMYLENEIQLRSDSWLAELDQRADLKTEKSTIWPPKAEPAKAERIGIDAAAVKEPEALDPIVGHVNGVAIKRSEVWRDLLRTEGEDALRRLINREVVLTILKEKGVPYMEWFCSNANHRSLNAPPIQPIHIKEEAMQRELNDDRIEFDKLLSEQNEMSHLKYSEYASRNPGKTEDDYKRAIEDAREIANMTFNDYVYRRYGQTEAEYRRAIEASLVLRAAIRWKVVPADKDAFERTLKFEFAMARDQYSQSPWFEISHILIVPSGGMLRADQNAQLAARMAADTIYKQLLEKPDSWAQLVEQFSDDTPENKARHGKLSGCYSDRTPPDVPESLQIFDYIKKENLEVGMVTPPMRSVRGYHIVRLDRKHRATQADYEEKRKQIEKDYINEQAKYYADIWVRALNSRAIVKHYLYKPAVQYEKDDIPDNFNLPPKE